MIAIIEQTAQIEDLSTAQLVAFYNERAAKPVKKFATRAIAIKRITELLNATQETETMDTVTEEAVEAAVVAVENIPVVEQARKALDASDPVETSNELPAITDLEHLVLDGLAESDFQDGSDPEDEKMVWSWSATDVLSSKKSAGGVVASLVKKGLVHHAPKSGDTPETIGFTALGAKVYREVVQKQPKPVVGKAPKAAKEPKAPKAPKAEKEPKAPSKVEIMFDMIRQEGGALKSELLKVCGWKGCAVALGRACEKNSMELSKTKLEGGDWTYKAVAKAA